MSISDYRRFWGETRERMREITVELFALDDQFEELEDFFVANFPGDDADDDEVYRAIHDAFNAVSTARMALVRARDETHNRQQIG